MLTALIRAVEEVFTPPLRRVVVLSLALALASFAALWIGLAILVHNTSVFGWWPLDWLINLFGAAALFDDPESLARELHEILVVRRHADVVEPIVAE